MSEKIKINISRGRKKLDKPKEKKNIVKKPTIKKVKPKVKKYRVTYEDKAYEVVDLKEVCDIFSINYAQASKILRGVYSKELPIKIEKIYNSKEFIKDLFSE